MTRLLVGNTVNVLNTVTGDEYSIVYGVDGRRVIQARNGTPSTVAQLGNPLHSGASYDIRPDGKLATSLDGKDFTVSVYKKGDQYIAARADEFGFANYELMAAK